MDIIRIVAVAIQQSSTGVILSLPKPNRHHHIINGFGQATGLKLTELGFDVQGFLTNRGTFVDRELGKEIAVISGDYRSHEGFDPKVNTYSGPKLFSEDLW